MKERPILFSGPMVRAILDGQKTQTRRVLKIPGIMPRTAFPITSPDESIEKWDDGTFHYFSTSAMSGPYPCPYGEPGDVLYVKETYWALGVWKKRYDPKKGRKAWSFDDLTIPLGRQYQFSEPVIDVKLRRRGGVIPTWWKRPSIFMPRSASRILLEITDVRVERLQDISEGDARAEGAGALITDNCGAAERALLDMPLMQDGHPYRNGFALLWESINGDGSWDANPWVWVVEFRRIQPCPPNNATQFARPTPAASDKIREADAC